MSLESKLKSQLFLQRKKRKKKEFALKSLEDQFLASCFGRAFLLRCVKTLGIKVA